MNQSSKAVSIPRPEDEWLGPIGLDFKLKNPLVIPKHLIGSFLKYSIDLEMVNKRNPIWCVGAERCDRSISILPDWLIQVSLEEFDVMFHHVECFLQELFSILHCPFPQIVHLPNEARCISFVSAPYLSPTLLPPSLVNEAGNLMLRLRELMKIVASGRMAFYDILWDVR